MIDEPGKDRNATERQVVALDAAGMASPDDPIMAEVRAVREGLFAEAGYDLDVYVRRVRAAQACSDHAVATLPPKPAD